MDLDESKTKYRFSSDFSATVLQPIRVLRFVAVDQSDISKVRFHGDFCGSSANMLAAVLTIVIMDYDSVGNL